MLSKVIRVDEDFAEINKDEAVEKITEDVINKSLEYRRSVSESEGHNEVLILTQMCVEGRFPLIAFSNANQVIGLAEIKLRKNMSLLDRIKSRIYERKRIIVFNSNLVQFTIIDAGSSGLVFLLNEEKPCTDWGE